ncbi:tRNA epoxyqueuosine(34) reductase QueG [Aurantivibrio plasticivorans]
MQNTFDLQQLADQIALWAKALGFQGVGIADTHLQVHETHLENWLDNGYHGSMQWMESHGTKRSRPQELLPGTLRVISVRMDYRPEGYNPVELLQQPEKAYISRYALGRDYHKLIRKRLAQLADKIANAVASEVQQRPFVDSAPVLERAIAEKSRLGWIGKNTMLIHEKTGSWFFLGELFTNIPLPASEEPATNHCGSCSACLDICPTNAFIGPYQLDARKCISYLTIEHDGSIPEELRALMGNRIYGCDDCQLVCPWNKFSHISQEPDFAPRHRLDRADLVTLFNWTEQEFLDNLAGSAIRRIGYEKWLRNIAVALGNAPSTTEVVQALEHKRQHSSKLVREHVVWALAQHQ